MMKRVIAVYAAGILLMTSISGAAAIRYQGNGDWMVEANWQGGVMPGTSDQARMNWGDNTVTLAAAAPDILNLQTGVDESGTLVINAGGSLTSLDWSMIGTAGACTGTLTVNGGGVMNINGHLWVAAGAGTTGIVNINGGTVNVGGIIGLGTINADTASGGTGIVNVNDGGLLALSNIHSTDYKSIFGSSYIDIAGTGKITLPDDFTSVIDAYVAAGKITGNGIAGNVESVFAGGMTTVTAIPEPVSVVLVGLGGLFIRKRRG